MKFYENSDTISELRRQLQEEQLKNARISITSSPIEKPILKKKDIKNYEYFEHVGVSIYELVEHVNNAVERGWEIDGDVRTTIRKTSEGKPILVYWQTLRKKKE